jgi:hypothetical protein
MFHVRTLGIDEIEGGFIVGTFRGEGVEVYREWSSRDTWLMGMVVC